MNNYAKMQRLYNRKYYAKIKLRAETFNKLSEKDKSYAMEGYRKIYMKILRESDKELVES